MYAVGLIAAAGMSRRMGQCKALLPVDGRPMIERTVSTFSQAGISEIYAVIGGYAEQIVQALRPTHVHFLYNAAYETADMFASIRLGIDYIASHTDAEAVFLLPVDMPAIPPSLLPQLLRCMERTDADLVFPSRNMRRLHPPLLRRRCFGAVTGYAGGDGLRGAFREMNGNIAYVATDDEGCTIDVDTPDDYQRLLQHLQEER